MSKKKYPKIAIITLVILVISLFILCIVLLSSKVRLIVKTIGYPFILLISPVLGTLSLVLGVITIVIVGRNREKYCGLWIGIAGVILGIVYWL